MKINPYSYRKFLILNVLIVLAILISIIYVNWNNCDNLIKELTYILSTATIGAALVVDLIYLVVEQDKLTPLDILSDNLVSEIKDLNPDLIARDDSVYDCYSEYRNEIENTK